MPRTAVRRTLQELMDEKKIISTHVLFKELNINYIKKSIHMKKLALILLIFIIFIYGCGQVSQLPPPPAQVPDANMQEKSLSDIQVTACDTAHDAGTCETRLAELGIVLKEDCCEVLGKCC